MPTSPDPAPLDLLGIGAGPAGLSLAALAHPVPGLTTATYEQQPAFHWHPGLLIEGTTLQVPYLADLVTLTDPTSHWTYLNYLKEHRRLYPFYFAERHHIPRTDYDAYCRWVSTQLPTLHFAHHIDTVNWNPEQAHFEAHYTHTGPDGQPLTAGRLTTRNIAISTGSTPHIPDALRPLAETPTLPVLHSAHYLDHREQLLKARHITIIGSGQSGAEIFLDLLRRRPPGAEHIHWLTRSPAFAPMEYSKLGLEHFTPDYTRYFHALDEATRERLLTRQWQLHKAIDHETIAAIHDELTARAQHGTWPQTTLTPGVTVRTAGRLGTHQIELHLEHPEQNSRTRLTTDALVLATGYRDRPIDPLLNALGPAVHRDTAGRPKIDQDYRLQLDPDITGRIFIAGAERHTHGIGTPDLGLVAHRSAKIINTLLGEEHYPLPERTAFTTFGLHTPQQPTPPLPGQRSSERTTAHS